MLLKTNKTEEEKLEKALFKQYNINKKKCRKKVSKLKVNISQQIQKYTILSFSIIYLVTSVLLNNDHFIMAAL